ncbi:MAG: helix-turn-helix transcriptional regulator [Pseudomonadota bacterium]
MSESALRKNLEKLVEKGRYQVADVERRAGVSKNTLHNILKGKSKTTTAEKLQSIAEVFGVTLNDLYTAVSDKINYLDDSGFALMQKVLSSTIEEAQDLKLKVTCCDIAGIISQIFNYSISKNISEPDKRFVKWILQEKFVNR